MNYIYIITVMTTPKKEEKIPKIHVVGWHETLNEAISAVLEDRGGLCEALYDYAVIEKSYSGNFSETKREQWFYHNDNLNKWEKCSPPEWGGWSNIGMG